MAQWGNTDDSANSVSWANTTLNLKLNKTELYGNTNVGNSTFGIANAQVGVFGISTDELAFANTAGSDQEAVAHAGWVLRKEGRGGRAGRVQMETLVAMSSISGDAGRIAGDPTDDDVAPEED